MEGSNQTCPIFSTNNFNLQKGLFCSSSLRMSINRPPLVYPSKSLIFSNNIKCGELKIVLYCIWYFEKYSEFIINIFAKITRMTMTAHPWKRNSTFDKRTLTNIERTMNKDCHIVNSLQYSSCWRRTYLHFKMWS